MFDSALDHLDRRHQLLLREAESAHSLAASHEMERDRLHTETVDNLIQADYLAKEVARLEQTVASKNSQVYYTSRNRFNFASNMLNIELNGTG